MNSWFLGNIAFLIQSHHFSRQIYNPCHFQTFHYPTFPAVSISMSIPCIRLSSDWLSHLSLRVSYLLHPIYFDLNIICSGRISFGVPLVRIPLLFLNLFFIIKCLSFNSAISVWLLKLFLFRVFISEEFTVSARLICIPTFGFHN